jgi:hypothetical protein
LPRPGEGRKRHEIRHIARKKVGGEKPARCYYIENSRKAEAAGGLPVNEGLGDT